MASGRLQRGVQYGIGYGNAHGRRIGHGESRVGVAEENNEISTVTRPPAPEPATPEKVRRSFGRARSIRAHMRGEHSYELPVAPGCHREGRPRIGSTVERRSWMEVKILKILKCRLSRLPLPSYAKGWAAPSASWEVRRCPLPCPWPSTGADFQ